MTQQRQEFFDESFLSRLEQLHLIAKRIATRTSSGLRRSHRMGDGLEFADHRPYAPGDDIRFIDWPYFARMEKLLLRMFHQHSEADVTILLDKSASMAPGGKSEKFDYARKAAAALAYVAMGSLERVSVLSFAENLGTDRAVHTGRNRTQVLDVLRFLSALETGGRTELAHCAKRFARDYPAGQTVLILSDLLDCDEQLDDALVHLRLRGHDVAVLHIFSPRDAAPELDGPVLLAQAETDRKLTANVTAQLLENYRTSWNTLCERCQEACTSRQAIYVSARTDIPFEQLILRSLRAAGVLGA